MPENTFRRIGELLVTIQSLRQFQSKNIDTLSGLVFAFTLVGSMPVTIACPKCQTKYKLPESSLGKALKCQKCGAGFKTRAPGQAGGSPARQVQGKAGAQPTKQPQKPAAPTDASQRQRSQEMKNLGIDGPLVRQGDIFGPALPQGAGQLGNFAAEDPGFESNPVSHAVDVEVQNPQGVQQSAEGMESILANPFVAPSAAGVGVKGRLKGSRSAEDGSYVVPKIGMWAVFVAAAILLVIVLLVTFFAMLAQYAPGALAWLPETIGRSTYDTIVKVFVIGIFVLTPSAILTIFVGQICCIFSPNKNEKLFAGLSVGAIGLAILSIVVLYLTGAMVGLGGGRASQTATAAFGLLALGAMLFGLMVLSNWFLFISYFKKVGKNLKSKKVMQASTTATLVCIGAFVFFFISAIAAAVMTSVLPDHGQTVTNVFGILNVLVGSGVTGAILAMIKTTLKVLKKKKA